MALLEGQASIRDLVVGPGTLYGFLDEFNPFNREVRSEATGAVPWGHGSWSGAEWQQEAVVPMNIYVTDQADRTIGRWLELQQQLAAAFRPVGENTSDVGLRFALGGREYVMFGRPRMINPEMRTARAGWAVAQAAFVALDPTVYSGVETTFGPLSPPSFIGGLTVPFTVPFIIGATITGGVATLENEGTKDTGLQLRIDGPVLLPRVTLEREDGVVQTLVVAMQLGSGEWLDIDTFKRTVTLNGTTSRRGQVSGDWPILPPGEHVLTFRTTDANPASSLTGSFRSAWW
jgi:hypothetical protein